MSLHDRLFARGVSDGSSPSPSSSLPSSSPRVVDLDSSAITAARSLLPNSTDSITSSIQPGQSTSIDDRNTNSIGFQVLGALLLVCCILGVVLCVLAPSCVRGRRRRRHRHAAMQRAAAAAQDSNSTQNNNNTSAQQQQHNHRATQKIRSQPAEERYVNIEAWLVSKMVTAHDAVCDRAMRAASKSSMSTSRSALSLSSLGSSCSGGESSATTSEEENNNNDQQQLQQNQNSENSWSECPICFDTIEPGDVVSWSPQPDCGHVFHHECIKEWLLKKPNCPFCRQTCLPIDAVVETHKKQIMELLRARQHRDIPCFYCAEHGVVRPPSHLLSSNNIITQKTMGLRSSSSSSNNNKNESNKSDDAAFHESLHERSHQTCCRTELQRMRGSTVGTEDELFTDLELQAASAGEDHGSSSTSMYSSGDGAGPVDDEEDHRETFRELPR